LSFLRGALDAGFLEKSPEKKANRFFIKKAKQKIALRFLEIAF
jgi:hypothetical protein